MAGTRASGTRVLIVGGGIIGCLCALRLKEMGAEPVILERGELGHEASWAGAGILCPIEPWLYPDAFTELVNASLKLYPDLARELETETGQSIEWRRTGLMIPFLQGEDDRAFDLALDWSRRFGWRVEALDTAEARQREPVLTDSLEKAVLWPEVAQVRNPRLLRAVRLRLRQLGVEMREHHPVARVRTRADGRVDGVVLADASEIPGDAVLLAAGSWTGELMRALGLELPIEPVKGQIALIRTEPGTVRHIIKHPEVYFVPRADGRVLIGATMERVGFRRGTTRAEIERLLASMRRVAPGLAQAPIERQWMGFRPGTPDGLPCLGPVRGVPGLWVASGHYRNGVVLAPVTAEVMAGWILGRAPALDMRPFDPGRTFVEHPAIGLPEARTGG